ncbi:Ig-like domain-containing protein [Erythrobacter sp. HA6-11]
MTDFNGSKNGDFDRGEMAHAGGVETSGLYQESEVSSSSARQIMMPDADGIVVLPQGVSLNDITVNGRDLIINLADGTQLVIPDGAIIVPQLVVDGVAVPPATVAALLNDAELNPEAGPEDQTPSSGGNFAGDEGAIQDPFDLGDLLPYTELPAAQEEEEETIPFEDFEPEIVIETPDNPIGVVNAQASVNEAGLPEREDEPEGTDEPSDSEATTGTIVITSPDGIGSISINGVEITGPGQEIVTELGVLTVTGIDLETGEVTYEYRLTDNTVGDDTTDDFEVTVEDLDSDTATATLTVAILDDAPIATDDTGTVPAGEFGPIDGNVVDNDVPGADDFPEDGAVTGFSNDGGTAAPGEDLQGEYGVLTLNPDGSYTYVRDPGTPGGVQDVFTYDIVDTDGSTATATLTIDIGDAPTTITFVPSTGAGAEVSEEGLPARNDESEGTDEPSDSETTVGTITFESPDGLGSVSVGGVVVEEGSLPQTIVSDDTGTLIVTGFTFDPVTGEGTLTYEYTLTDNTDGDDTSVDFDLVVTDLDGDEATDTLTITIVDDAPEALDDTAGQVEENDPVTVNVLENDIEGADGVEPSTVELVEGTLTGSGTLVNNGDGTFTYTPAASDPQEVTFDYQITDGDGDTSIATVTLSILPDSPISIEVEGDNDVDEAGLPARGDEPAGSDDASDSEIATGVIAIETGNDTLASLVINGVDVTNGGEVTTDRGVLTITLDNGEYSYSYELTDNTSGDDTSDEFTLDVVDSDGSTDSTTLTITIVDDTPEAFDDSNSIEAGEFGPVEGNVLTNDTVGADDAVVTNYVGSGGSGDAGETVQGTYGTLTINGDGTYSYTRDPGTPGGVEDVFTYTITDGDGDTSTAELVIDIADAPVTLDLPAEGEGGTIVDEDGLAGPPAGSAADTDSEFTTGTFTFAAGDGVARVLIDGVEVTAVGQTFTGAHGTLTIDAIEDGSITYTYELTSPTSGDNTSDDFVIRVEDNDDDFAESTLEIAIVDDEPTVSADEDSVTEDGPLTADGNVLTGTGGADANDTDGVADVTGADGASVTGVAAGDVGADVNGSVGSAVTGAYGSITIDADGDYVYSLDNDNPLVQGLDGTETLSEVFTYTITDGDGDPATTTVTITIDGVDDPVVINGLDGQGSEETVDEDDLPDGTSPNDPALTPDGTFSVDSPDGLDTLTVGGVEVFGDGVTYPVEIEGEYGTIRITGVTPTIDDNGDVTSVEVAYEYVLDENTLDHSPTTGEDSLTDSFDVVATDTDGSTSTASLDVDVIDDVPEATDNSNTVTEGGETSGNVLTDDDGNGVDNPGADGYAAGSAVIGVTSVNEGTSDGETDGDGNFVIEGEYGTLTLNADGSYTYVANPNVVNADETDTFTYTIRDGDGDEATAELVITVANVAGEVSDNDVIVNEAGLMDGTGELADDDAGNDSDTSESGSGQITVTGATGTLVYILEDPADGAFGTLTLNPDGSYTYVLDTAFDHDPDAPGADTNTANGVESFSYRVEDTNGNVIGSGEIVVSVIDDIPQVDLGLTQGAPMALETQDADTIGNASDTDSADFSGAFAVVDSLFGADGAGTLETTYALGLTVAEGTDSGLNSNDADIFLYVSDDGTIIGSTSATEPAAGDASVIFTLTVDANGTVTLTQLAEVDHSVSDDGGPFDGDAVLLGSGLVELVATATITDSDGDVVSDSEALDLGGLVGFADDGPVAVADVNSVGEDDASVSGNVLTDGTADDFGADGPATTTPAGGVVGVELGDDTSAPATGAPGTPIVGAWGTLTLAADGSYTYVVDSTAVQGLGDGETETDTFIYTIEDGDGDTSTVTLTITINGANDAPTAVAGVAAVSDEGLADSNPDNAGTPTDTTNSATFLTGDLQIADADTNDTLDVTLGIPTETISIVDGSTAVALTWAVIDGGNTLVGYVSDVNDPSVIVAASDDGTYTVEILDPIFHDETGVEDVESFVVPVTVSDGTASTPTTITVSLEDDSPILTAPIADEGTSNDPGAPIVVGDLNFEAGADGPSADVSISVDTTGLTVGGQPLATEQEGNVLTAFVDANGNGEFDTGDTAAFTVTVDPTAGTSGEYEFDLITPLDGATTLIDLLSDGAFGVGPSQSVLVTQGTTGDELVFVTGWEPNGNGGELTGGELNDWLNGGNPDLTQVPGVNGSTAGFGVDNNNFDTGEFLRFDLGSLDDYDGAGGYTPPGGTNLLNATSASFTVSNFGNGDVTHFVAHFSDGSTQEFTLTGSGGGNGSATVNIVAPPGLSIAWVDAYQEDGSVKLNLSDLGVTDTNVDIDIPVTVELTDGDGDPVSDTFVINIGDDAPIAQDDLFTAQNQALDLNVSFVLDFSSSIDNGELNTQLTAVQQAAAELFASTNGAVSITLVGFDANALSFGTFDALADIVAFIDTINPEAGGTRPLTRGTNYSAALTELTESWDSTAGDVNQMFFISDGRPSRGRGPNGEALNDAAEALWTQFVADNDFDITTIGIGDGIRLSGLEAVDIDGEGSPILIDNFSDLIDSIVTATILPVSGNVLDNDAPSANGIELVSISIDGQVYSFDGSDITAPGGGTIAGDTLMVTTAMGGDFTFSFATGDWIYVPSQAAPTGMENFQYTVVDSDGDTDTAILRIDLTSVEENGGVPKADIQEPVQAVLKVVDGEFAGEGGPTQFGTGADLANDNQPSDQRGIASAQIAAAGLGFAMVNFAEMGSDFGNTSFTLADGIASDLTGDFTTPLAEPALGSMVDLNAEVLGADNGFSVVELSSDSLAEAIEAPATGFADFAAELGNASNFELGLGLGAPVSSTSASPVGDAMAVDGSAGLMEALLDLSDASATELDLADATGLATGETVDVVAILDDIMAESAVDALLETLADNADIGSPIDAASSVLSEASLTQTVDGSAFAFDATQLADLSAEAAAVAASVG